ncbi:hypothetical protein VTI74DRAFT_857 [Chaetomium olivicolor]
MGQWQSQPVCTTPACIHAASQVLRNLHPQWEKLDPCVDFDKMVCYGNKEHEGDDEGTMTDVNNRNMNILRKILESSSHAEAAGVESTFLTARGDYNEYNFDMLRTAYQTCMDEKTALAVGAQPLADLFITVNKTWPVSPTDLKTKVGTDYSGLVKASIMFEQFGVQVFHTLCGPMPVIPDPTNSKLNRVCFNPPKVVSQNKTIYSDPAGLEDYATGIANWFQLTYPNLGDKAALELATSVAVLEAGISELLSQEKFAEEDLPTNITLKQLGSTAPALGLDKLVAALTPSDKTPEGILVYNTAAWPELSKFISQQPKAAVQGWMMWKAVDTLGVYVDVPKLFKQTQPRWERCVLTIRTTLMHLLESYFVSATYPDQTLQAADRMTTGIRAQLKKRIGQLDWMGAESKVRASKKADNIKQNVGYPTSNPDFKSAESLATYYDGVNVTSTSHFSNVLSGLRHNTLKAYGDAALPVPQRATFLGPISQVNAFYFGLLNIISIPAGITQLPIFHYHLPDYALYGGLGSVIGHELTHGFDSNGRLTNEDGEIKPWWDNVTISNFEERAQCFVKQFSKFEVNIPGGKGSVDGEQTLAENLADAGGLRLSYEAWVEDRKTMPNTWNQGLPGLEKFTQEQLFFLFWGNIWCSNETPEGLLRSLRTDTHSPNSVRIRGGVQNSRAFKDAFKCKVKEPVCELF